MATYTNEEIYQLFHPSEVPSNFAEFDVFGSEECLLPVGSQKPENVPDYTQKAKNRQVRKPQQQQQKDSQNHGKTVNIGGVHKKINVTKVEVNPEIANTKISWGKPKAPPPAPAQAQENKPAPVPENPTAVNTSINANNKPAKPAPKKPVASWGDVSLKKEIAPAPPQPKQPQVQQENPKPQTYNKPEPAKPSKPAKHDSEWPSLEKPSSNKKPSNAWANIKP